MEDPGGNKIMQKVLWNRGASILIGESHEPQQAMQTQAIWTNVTTSSSQTILIRVCQYCSIQTFWRAFTQGNSCLTISLYQASMPFVEPISKRCQSHKASQNAVVEQ